MCGQGLNLSQTQTNSERSAHTPRFPAPKFDLEAQQHQRVTEKEEIETTL